MIEVKNFSISQGEFGLRQINLAIPTGNYGVLMGRSGSGKTTILEAVCGLRKFDAGQIILGDRDVTAMPPGDRGIGYVPQDGALFPGLLVREQLAFALVVRQRPQEEIARRVNELAEMLGITALLDRLPDKLSGGEKQRVAFGRALAIKPKILCFDEPLSALDDDTHTELIALIKDLSKKVNATVLHITHSRHEAEQLADTIFLLRDGAITAETVSPS
jgi:ABC-type sugar transport system ATPase subunit